MNAAVRRPHGVRRGEVPVAQTDGEVTAVQERREQLVEELHKSEQARDLLRELERRLTGEDRPELEATPDAT